MAYSSLGIMTVRISHLQKLIVTPILSVYVPDIPKSQGGDLARQENAQIS